MKEICPECGSKMSESKTGQDAAESNAASRCPNLDCPAKVRAQLEHWCAREVMDIEGGEAFIAPLVQRGLVRDVAELYQLTESDLLQLLRVDKNSAGNFLAALEASKSRDWWRLLFGLGIPHVEAGVSKACARSFKTLDDVMHASFAQLNAMEDLSEVIARSVAQWFKDSHNRKLIERLRDAGLNFRSSSAANV